MRAGVGWLLLVAACGFGDDRTSSEGVDAVTADASPDASTDGPGPDGPGPDAPTAACTLVPQSGCPAGRACDLIGDDGDTACREITSQGTADDVCAGASRCAAGWSCRETIDESSCLEFCATDADCAPASGSRCLIVFRDGAGDPVPGGTFCSQLCSPQNASGCPPTWNCTVVDDPSGDLTRCFPAGPGEQDDVCVNSYDCAAGYTCATYDNTRTCLHNCRVGVSGACNGVPGTTCTGFVSPDVIAGVEWGVCL